MDAQREHKLKKNFKKLFAINSLLNVKMINIVISLYLSVSRHFFSYNRATALSLANFVRNFFDFPLLGLAAWLIKLDVIYPYILALVVGGIVALFFRLSPVRVRPMTL